MRSRLAQRGRGARAGQATLAERVRVVHLGRVVVEERVVRAGVVVDLDVAAGRLDAVDGGLDAVGAREVPSSSEQWIIADLPA